MAVSFIGRKNWSNQRKSPTCHKSLTNFVTYCCIEYTSPWTEFELTTSVVIDTDCIGRRKSNYHTFTTTTAHFLYWYFPSKFFIISIHYINYLRHHILCTTALCWHFMTPHPLYYSIAMPTLGQTLRHIFYLYWSVINRTYKCKLRPHRGILFSNTCTKLFQILLSSSSKRLFTI
jgi:hypothetical protein